VKRLLILGPFLLILLLLGILILRTLTLSPPTRSPTPPLYIAPRKGELTRLQRFLTFPTISPQNLEEFDPVPFQRAKAFLSQEFPLLHRYLKLETFHEHTLLYKWEGKDPQAPPLVLMGHLDVVPVPPETLSEWKYPPFSGTLAEGYIWGRGALDDKSSVLAICEAVEALLAEGFQPDRTIFLAFGHDEEIGGTRGARAIAERFQKDRIQPLLVLDEGLAVLSGVFPSVTSPVALVGVAEKGYMSVELTVTTLGGHSSMPTPENAILILSRALLRLQSHPFRSKLTPMVEELLETLAPAMGFPDRLVLANLWFFDPLVRYRLSKNPGLNAAIRTTLTPTIFSAGMKENLLPPYAQAIVNIRVLPGDDRKKVLERIEKIIADPRIYIRELSGIASDPSPIAPRDTPEFKKIASAIRAVYPDALVAPGLVVGATDSRYFTGLTDAVYRFSPHLLTQEDLKLIHGVNERISIEGYRKAIEFYIWILLSLGK
jgi:carboxypeptidase PM20D1